MRARNTLLLALAATLALAGAALAADRQAALGDAGEVYLVQTGNYGDLFPGATATPAGNAVLALDVVRPGQPAQRLLVPGTDGIDVESSPFELYEPSSGTLFLVWQAQINSISPVLYLTSYKDGAWSPALRITGNPFALKSAPQFAITHDTYDVLAADGTYTTLPRTILHLIWWEEAANGGSNVQYAPILLVDGNYVGTNQVFSLNSFLTGITPGNNLTGVAPDLFRAPHIQAGANARTVLVGFADPVTQRLVTMEISTLPGELVSLTDKMRAHIIESGARFLPGNLNGLGADVHDWILGSGARLHPGVLSYLAEKARAHIIESGIKSPGQLTPLAADARAHIIESGATMVGDRIDNVTAKSDSSAFTPMIAEIPTTETDGAGPAHLFQVNVDSLRPLPRTGTAPNAIYVSQDGSDAVVSWDMPGEVRYRESTDQGWGPIKVLSLSSGLDLNRAHSILDQRVRDR